MNNKKTIILIIVAIGAAISLYYGFTASPKSKYATSNVQKEEMAVKNGIAPQVQNITGVERRAKRTKFVSMLRRPFIPRETAVSGITLNGIVWHKEKPRAIINNNIVAPGDMVGESKVVRIEQDRVILNDGLKDFELKLKE